MFKALELIREVIKENLSTEPPPLNLKLWNPAENLGFKAGELEKRTPSSNNSSTTEPQLAQTT
jgi:hypothetical protein